MRWILKRIRNDNPQMDVNLTICRAERIASIEGVPGCHRSLPENHIEMTPSGLLLLDSRDHVLLVLCPQDVFPRDQVSAVVATLREVLRPFGEVVCQVA